MRWLIIGFVAALCVGTDAMADEATEERNTCEQECRVEQSRCITACGEHSEPMECEAECQDQAEDCERACSR